MNMLVHRSQIQPFYASDMFLGSVTVRPEMGFLCPGFCYLRVIYCFCVIQTHHTVSQYYSFIESVGRVSNVDKTDHCLSLSYSGEKKPKQVKE